MLDLLECVNRHVWGIPTLILIVGIGLYFTIRTGFAQFVLFPKAIKRFCGQFARANGSDSSSRKAVCTALAATVGIGNIVGVAGAIALGGPGAVFWMWVCALLGMIIKYAEATLAVRYRVKDSSGGWVGGPMYIIQQALPCKWASLGAVYSFLGVVAAFGVGNATQVNAAIGGIHSILEYHHIKLNQNTDLIIAIIFAVIVVRCLISGAGKVGDVTQYLVPFMSCLYIIMGLWIIFLRYRTIPSVFRQIIIGAWNPEAFTGGIVGSMLISLRTGASRGVFTNEAGMGTAAIAHASSNVKHPCEQGLMGIVEVFLDTIVICTITALVILCSGVSITYGTDPGGELTNQAFTAVLGSWSNSALSFCIILFAFATILGWGVYGAQCATFLFGSGAWKWFVFLQGVAVIAGAMLKTESVWLLSEIFNGLMSVPNLLMLILTSQETIRLTKEYFKLNGRESAEGETNENIYQCKPLRTISYEKIPSPCRESKKKREEDLSFEYRSAGS